MILVQLTDLHLRPPGVAAYRTAETNMLTERALRAVRNLPQPPDVIVISGDLTDCGLAAEYEVLTDLLQRLVTVPVLLIPGNHDRREVMRAAMRHMPGVNDDPEFIQYSTESLALRLVMLDTVVPGASHGALCAARLDWLEATLAAQPDRPTVLVMHHPPFISGIRAMDRVNLRNSDEFTAVIARHRQVQRILCGHHHRPIVAPVAQAIASVAPSVAHQLYQEGGPVVAHTAHVESFPGPFPFLLDPDYPGKTG
jgi:3',5'-cyclic AMP phosphodiesterase CpdA